MSRKGSRKLVIRPAAMAAAITLSALMPGGALRGVGARAGTVSLQQPICGDYAGSMAAGSGGVWVGESPDFRLPPDMAFVATNGSQTRYATPRLPRFMTAGAGGNLWFTDGTTRVDRMTPSGSITEFAVPVARGYSGELGGIGKGPDGNVWVTVIEAISPVGGTVLYNNQVARFTPSGSLTEFPVVQPLGAITTGSDGNLWAAPAGDGDFVDRITTTGVETTYHFRQGHAVDINAIYTGPDGALWFGMFDGSTGWHLIRLTTSATVTLDLLLGAAPTNLATGADGRVWFGHGGGLDAVTTAGALSAYPFGFHFPATAQSVALGPDGRVWFIGSAQVGAVATTGLATQWGLPSTPATTCQVTPAEGPQQGGTSVTIHGHDFSRATAVLFGSVPAPSWSVVADDEIVAAAPPGPGGTSVPVSVTTPDGPGLTGATFLYIQPPQPPQVLSLSPNCGPTGGGTTVTIVASDASPAEVLAVTFGGVSAHFEFAYTKFGPQLLATSPAHAAGTVDIRVENMLGWSNLTEADEFAYDGPLANLECQLGIGGGPS